MDGIYNTVLTVKPVHLPISSLSGNTRQVNELLLCYLKKTVEGRCCVEGYVRPHSIQLLKQSCGGIANGGTLALFQVELTMEVFLVQDETILQGCTVTKVHQGGIEAEIRNGDEPTPATIIILNEGTGGHDVKIGGKIDVEVVCSRHELNDTSISIIGKLVNRNENFRRGAEERKQLTKKKLVGKNGGVEKKKQKSMRTAPRIKNE